MLALLLAVAAIVLHVANYNGTAHIEFKTRWFTKNLLGRNTVYLYALYLLLSAGIRDHCIQLALDDDSGSFPVLGDASLDHAVGLGIFLAGFGLNLWTLQALGIKGMYNGDSFGWLMDAPVTGGPFAIFNDPQYVGTTAAMFGWAVKHQSANGMILTVVMGIVFYISVKFVEGPHMARLYDPRYRRQNKLY